MKTIKVFLGMLAIASLGFVSCNDDDKDVITGDNNLGIAGTYDLTEFNTGDPTDFNKDGTPHKNQIEESDCYAGSKLTLNADGTMSYVIKEILVDVANNQTTCSNARTVQGTWKLEGGTGTSADIKASYSDGNENVTADIVKTGNKLRIYKVLSRYPDRNDAGNPVYTLGTVEYIFTKQ